MRHNHTSPFEMAELKFIVRVPIDIWRQWVRHRTASINEHSTRYREAIDETAIPADDEWRFQSTTKKQGSEGKASTNLGWNLGVAFSRAALACREAYQSALHHKIAYEQARSILPLCTYTEAYWKIDLHNLMHFLRLRMAPDAQQEIRDYANAIHDLIEPLFPLTMQAFADYRLCSMQLTALDIMAIAERDWTGETIEDARERREYLQKLEALKLGRG
jgi:thymidylate synthase (FAD)